MTSEAIRRRSSTKARSLALGELEALAGALLTVLLTLLDASVAGQQAISLQGLAQFSIELKQGAGNAELDCIACAVTPPPFTVVITSN